MKIKHLVASLIIFTSILFVPIAYSKDRVTWMIELPKVMCIDNKVWLFWKSADYAIHVTGIFLFVN